MRPRCLSSEPQVLGRLVLIAANWCSDTSRRVSIVARTEGTVKCSSVRARFHYPAALCSVLLDKGGEPGTKRTFVSSARLCVGGGKGEGGAEVMGSVWEHTFTSAQSGWSQKVLEGQHKPTSRDGSPSVLVGSRLVGCLRYRSRSRRRASVAAGAVAAEYGFF